MHYARGILWRTLRKFTASVVPLDLDTTIHPWIDQRSQLQLQYLPHVAVYVDPRGSPRYFDWLR